MSLRVDRPVVVCTLAVSLAALGAAVAPARALADGSPEQAAPSISVTDATAAAVAALPAVDGSTDTTGAADVVADALPSSAGLPADDATAADATVPAPSADTASVPDSSTPAPAAGSSDAAPLPETTTSPAPEDTGSPDPAPQTASGTIEEGDTTAGRGGIETDTPTQSTGSAVLPPPPPAPSPPPAAQAPPAATTSANVNVTVRIGSPGDNGAVTQVNVVGTTRNTGGTASPSTSTPTPPASAPASASPSTGTESTPQAGPPPAPTARTSDTWYWSWDCLGMDPITAIPPTSSGEDSFPTSWTWIWNCDGNGSQYQPETPSGYQQINTNIAIRISSPGDDGPVTQVNQITNQITQMANQVTSQVTSQVTNGVLGTHGSPTVPGLPPLVPPVISLPPVTSALVAEAVGTTESMLGITLPLTAEDGPATTSAPPWTAASPLAGQAPVAQAPVSVSTPETAAGIPAGAGRRAASADDGTTAPPPVAVAPGLPAPWAPGSSQGNETTRSGGASRPRDAHATDEDSQPRWRPAPPHSPPPTPISGVSAAAVGGGSSPGGGVPFLLALPFVAVLLDLARRVALDRATWPSGLRRRDPDPPG